MATIKFVNLTPHPVQIWKENLEIVIINPQETPARCEEIVTSERFINDIPIVNLNYSNVTGLPPPAENTIYIVSILVAQNCPGRQDLLVPYDLVRTDKGQIIGCRKLASIRSQNG